MQAPGNESTSGWVARLDEVEGRALAWIASRRTPTLVGVMRIATRTGDASVVTAALVSAVCLWPGRATVSTGAAAALALLLFVGLKRLCRRARPRGCAVLAAPDRFSMPSGHASCAWAVAVALSVLVPGAAPIVCSWALAVSLSRVVLGVHYPLDVVAGAFLGSTSASLVLIVALGR